MSGAKGCTMTRVLITGAEGYIGSHLVPILCSCDEIQGIIGLDVQKGPFQHPKYQFIHRDVREPIADLVSRHAVGTIVHLAYVVAPIHDEQRMEEINLRGAANVLDACAAVSGVHLLYTSSTSVYGLHADNQTPFTEDSPLRPNEDFIYVKNKGQIEEMVRRFASDHPEACVTVLRPCFVMGPGAAHPLALHLQKRIVFLPWSPPPFQFVHVRDLAQIMRHFIAYPRSGVYNVAGAGEVTFAEMVKMLGNFRFPTHWPVMYAVNHLAWLLRLSFITCVPSPVLKMIRHPWQASTEKLREETGYEFAFDSRSAFQDFADTVRASRRGIWPWHRPKAACTSGRGEAGS